MSDGPINRRRFLLGATRLVAAGGLVGGCALLVLRSDDCGRESPCEKCGSLSGCALPRAAQWREKAEGEKEVGHG